MKTAVMVMLAAAFALSAALYRRLPQTMPIHWNAQGVADNVAPRLIGAFLLPVVMIGVWLLFAALPRMSPRGFEVEADSRAFRSMLLSIMAFLLATHAVTLAATLGALNVARIAPLLAGAFFVVLGNYLGTVRRNFFIGIRTPWTLANEHVWFLTHRLAARVFVLAGMVILIATPLLGEAMHRVLLPIIVAAALVPVVYSYVAYRRIATEIEEGESTR
jgi:uncharacterized membrane protein